MKNCCADGREWLQFVEVKSSMGEIDSNFTQRRPLYSAASELLVFNCIALIISIMILASDFIGLHLEGKYWCINGGILIVIQLFVLLPFTIASLVRRRSTVILRTLNSLVLFFGIVCNAYALGSIWYDDWLASSGNTFYSSGLYKAIKSGNLEKVNTLLEEDSNLVWSGFRETPITLAVKKKDMAMVKLLLSKEPTLAKSQNDWGGMTSLHWAVKVGDEEIAKILIDHDARINEGDNWGKTPLALAQEIRNKSMVDLLKAHGATEQDYEAMILWAIQQGDYDTVKKLLEKGVDVNMSVPNGNCLIDYAAESGHRDIAELLVEKGASIRNTEEYSPLDRAVEEGHLDMVKFFISKGANPKRRTYFNGMTLAEQAREWGHSDIADYLDSLNVPK
ncbi:MAG: ankyrin repeat domain-containing protein [Planctomycetota bacterium]